MRRKYPSEEQFKSMLEAKKLTEQDLRESTRKKIYVDEYLEKNGMRNPEVPEKKIKEYYQSNKKSFQREESIRVSHILVKVDENAEPEAKEKARAKTEKLRKELIAGKDFAEIAKEHSEDANALQGGDLGYIRRRYMPPEFDQAAFALKKDTLSSIVKTKYGYHIIKVVDKKPGGIAPYDDVKDFIIKYLQGSYARENMTSHIRELKKKADIEILLNES
jgi:peptidyl-prolyl cis-trans isomerase C